MKHNEISDVIYIAVSIISCCFFIVWACYNGIIKRRIEFGNIGVVTKTGRWAQIWGVIFASLGFAVLLTLIFFVI